MPQVLRGIADFLNYLLVYSNCQVSPLPIFCNSMKMPKQGMVEIGTLTPHQVWRTILQRAVKIVFGKWLFGQRSAIIKLYQFMKSIWSLSSSWYVHRADSMLAPSEWETSLPSNAESHRLGANLKSAPCIRRYNKCNYLVQVVYIRGKYS